MLTGRLQFFQEALYFELEDQRVNEIEEIHEWRNIFKQFGKDPNRYRHSADALYRRIQKQNYIPSTHSAVDLNNFFSLQYRLPIGIYDLKYIHGNVLIRPGHTDEYYHGINNRHNHLENLIVSTDEKGPFGSPYVDSQRTAVTEKTTRALHIVYLSQTMNKETAVHLLKSIGKMFTDISGGEFRIDVVGCCARSND